MAEKAPEKEKAKPGKGDAKEGGEKTEAKGGGGGLFTKTPVLLGIVMILEAVVLFAGFKFLGGGPKHADAALVTGEEGAATGGEKKAEGEGGGEGKGGEGEKGGEAKPAKKHDPKSRVEVQVLDFRAPNKQGARTFLYDVTIYISVKADAETKVKDLLKQRDALIRDRVRTIIAQSDPEKLGGGSEPGLETLRRQVKHQLDELIGDGVIDEVLVPRCIPFPVNF